MLHSTLCYIERDGKYLMLHRVKKKQDINAGKWIGVGGKIEPGETPLQCITREVYEETGLTLQAPEYRGIVHFSSDGFEETTHLFTCKKFTGELRECDEGDLKWVKISEIENLPIWEGDRVFLRLLPTETRFFEITLDYVSDRLVKSDVIFR